MNEVRLLIDGDDKAGWRWTALVGDSVVFETAFLARDDLAAALFSIQRDRDRLNSLFDDATDAEAFFVLDRFFFGGLNAVLADCAETQTWAKHLATPTVPTTVSSHLYLIAGSRTRLLIGREGQLTTSIELSDFDSMLMSCRAQLEQVQ